MLYKRWCAVVAERPGEIAIRDSASGMRWTFTQLRAAAEAISLSDEKIIFPRTTLPEFLMDVLAGWRHGKVVCPLEPGTMRPDVPAPPPNIAHLKLTSATTGPSRCVAFTAAQLEADVQNIIATMGLRVEWPNLAVISMAHSYGFSNLVLPLLLHGIPLIHVSHPLPEMVRRAAEGEIALTVAGVPALWRAWHEAQALPANVRLAISAGAPLPMNLEAEIFKSTGVKVHNFYGASECGGIAYDAAITPRTDDSCVGQPMRNVKLELNSRGCLVVRSAAAGERYWPISDDALGNGSFQTSDLAELKDGAVYLRGRASDLINVAGRKVGPEVIERVLRLNLAVRDCLVFGAPSEDAGRTDVIVAVVVAQSNENELKAFLQQNLPAWQVPRKWLFVESLPVNERGKISRAAWRQRYVDGLR
ncbi:MAG TPA: fatty acid--CoA ligase family protein [Verrucomicrobiae bacterium]|jgi:acyl-coenzyme A synthetase/AMP-(fatty) acid ligase|nr:fatty acid--CoA ligase family protein [Verrucomicrobiae bacterium]